MATNPGGKKATRKNEGVPVCDECYDIIKTPDGEYYCANSPFIERGPGGELRLEKRLRDYYTKRYGYWKL